MFFEDLINGQQIEQNPYLTSDTLAFSTWTSMKFVRTDFHFMFTSSFLKLELYESFDKLVMGSCWPYTVRSRPCYLYHFLSSLHI